MPKRSSRSRATARPVPGGEASTIDLGCDKLYFKIGEVAEIVGVPAYVLRYWESEFPAIRPQKSRSQQRVYRRRDVEILLKIKSLLYQKKFTIAGARQQLDRPHDEIEAAPPSAAYRARQSLERLRGHIDGLAAVVRGTEDRDPAAADPAEYLRAHGGAEAILAGTAERMGETAPLLARPERDAP